MRTTTLSLGHKNPFLENHKCQNAVQSERGWVPWTRARAKGETSDDSDKVFPEYNHLHLIVAPITLCNNNSTLEHPQFAPTRTSSSLLFATCVFVLKTVQVTGRRGTRSAKYQPANILPPRTFIVYQTHLAIIKLCLSRHTRTQSNSSNSFRPSRFE